MRTAVWPRCAGYNPIYTCCLLSTGGCNDHHRRWSWRRGSRSRLNVLLMWLQLASVFEGCVSSRPCLACGGGGSRMSVCPALHVATTTKTTAASVIATALIILIAAILLAATAAATVLDIETNAPSSSSSKRVVTVMVGDGYTAADTAAAPATRHPGTVLRHSGFIPALLGAHIKKGKHIPKRSNYSTTVDTKSTTTTIVQYSEYLGLLAPLAAPVTATWWQA